MLLVKRGERVGKHLIWLGLGDPLHNCWLVDISALLHLQHLLVLLVFVGNFDHAVLHLLLLLFGEALQVPGELVLWLHPMLIVLID